MVLPEPSSEPNDDIAVCCSPEAAFTAAILCWLLEVSGPT